MADNLTPLSDVAKANAWLVVKMEALELKSARAVREHLLGDPSALARVQAIDNQIAAFRAQITKE